MNTKVIIIGSGPAGLMCGNYLKRNNIPFIILEKNSLPGKKLLLTGGSRCNVTNNLSRREFSESLTVNKKFLYSTLSNFSTNEIISFFKEQNVELVLDKEFKYFPSTNKSKTILDALTKDIKEHIILNEEVINVKEEFIVKTKHNTYKSDYLVVATGSKSFPKTGSTGFGIKIANKYDIDTEDFYPAETSIYSKFIKRHSEELMGISIEKSNISLVGSKIKYQGDILFTHFGLSGPGIYHLSEDIYKQNTKKITISLTNKTEQQIKDVFSNYKSTDKQLRSFIEEFTIKRLAKFLMSYLNLENKKVKETSNKTLNKLIESLLRFEVEVTKVEDKELAYVNGGGVSVKELNPKTFMTKKQRNLFFIGETVDVHGPIGGFNITIASSMGHTVADAISKNILTYNE